MISIVISSYNYARFVGAAIESALAQTHPDIEVIVVDDGSSDGSPEVIAGYEGSVRAAVQENRGQGGAVNRGYAMARGDVVLFLDSDDMLLPGAAAAAAAAAEDESVAQILWNVAEVDAHGTRLGNLHPGELANGDLLAVLRRDGPLQWPTPPTSGNAWTRRYLEGVMPIPESDFRLNPDAYLSSLAPLHGRLRAVDEPQTLYRVHGANHSNKPFDELLLSVIDVRQMLAPIVVEHARGLGVDLDPTDWPERGWDHQLARALEELDAIIEPGLRFILVDGTQLGIEQSHREPVRFLERDGEYWGEPADDAEAIRELDRLRGEGLEFLALAWPSFWWVDSYPQFMAHLRTTSSCRLANERLQIFDLR